LAKEFVEVWDGEDPAMQLVSGTDHVAILTKSGKVFTYGSSDQGQLGRLAPTYCARDGWRANKKADAEAKLMFGAEYEQKMEEIEKRRTSFPAMHSMLNFNPVTIKKKKGYGSITAIAAGGWSTNAIFESGNVFSWGLNNYGQLGYKTGTKTVEFKPKEATTFGHLKVASISAGQHHTALLTLDGEVHTIGRGDTGQLGIEFAADAKKESAVPVKVNGMEGTITAISTGSTCTFALNADGKAYAWGFGENHQLGTPDDEDRGVPTLLCGQQVDDRRIINIDSGGQHSCATAVDM
jgi:regulator of chromosome condensation